MSKDGLLPSEEQLDDFFGTEESEELQEDVEETPETEEEDVTLSQEEYDDLKKGQMLQADYTRKRQEESQRIKDLESQLKDAEQVSIQKEATDLEVDLDMTDLPDSVKQKVSEVDKIKRELEAERNRSQQTEAKRRADEMVSDLNSLESDYPAMKNKAVKFAVMAFASQVLNNPTKEGFKQAAKEINAAYKTVNVAKQQEMKKHVKKTRATSPSIGSGGSAPIRTVDAPKNLHEANDLVMDALAKMNSLQG